MRLKSFHAPTLAEAMSQVRELLGDDAIIVATREEKNGAGVRVTAATDETEAEPNGHAGFAIADHALAGDAVPVDRPSGTDRVIDLLMKHNVPGGLIDELVGSTIGVTNPDPAAILSAALDRTFGFAPLAGSDSGRPLMLVGPPGSGKTLSVAKLAAEARLAGRSVALFTTDAVRAGGVEQLQALGRVLGLDLITAEDAESLGDGIETLPGHDLVLIDTDGRIPFDARQIHDLGRMVKAAGAEPILTLAAGADAEESGEIARCFGVVGVSRMIVTRTDAVRRFGGLLTAARRGGLEFAAMTGSPAAADPLSAVTPSSLARLFLPDTTDQGR